MRFSNARLRLGVSLFLFVLISGSLAALAAYFEASVEAQQAVDGNRPFATLTVTNTNDSGAGSLRQTVIDAAPGDTIVFGGGVTGAITLTSGQITINKNLTINGPGAAVLAISGNNVSRVLFITIGVQVALSGITVRNGNVAAEGGGIRNEGTLNLSNSAIINNHADGGGGIWSSGTSTVVGATISGNSATFDAGGFYNFGNSATASLINTTISNNTGNSAGLGNGSGGAGNSALLTLTNCTVTANTGNAAILSFNFGGAVVTTILRNTIIAGNSNANFSTGGGATVNSQGFTLDSDGTSGLTNGVNGNIVGTIGSPINAMLGPLANNGGPTQTRALLAGSPAIDKGSNTGSGVTTDQRGSTRIVDLANIANASGGDGTDIGAFEVQAEAVAPTADVIDVAPDPRSSTVTSVTIVFSEPVSGFDLADLSLTRNGGANLITGSQTLTTSNNITYTLGTLSGLTGNGGNYLLTLTAAGSGIIDVAGNALAGNAADTWVNTTPVPPATFTVTNLNDSGAGSLRQAILNANANSPAADTINFQAGLTGTIPLTTGQLTISDSVTINGPGANVVTVLGAANGANRIFSVAGGVTFNLSGFTLSGTNAPSVLGCGVYNQGTANVTNSVVSNNTCLIGGGLANAGGTMTVTNSTISGNRALSGNGGGGLYNQDSGTITIINSTVSGNTGAGAGAGLSVIDGTATIVNSTFTANTSNSVGGGGIYTQTPLILKNSIVANNTAPTANDIFGTVSSQGYNLIGDTSGTTITGTTTGNQLNVAPLLGSLASNGGPTQTHALLAGSPAIDKGSNSGSGVTTDQRGSTRVIDLASIANASGGDGTDIGAYEAQTDPNSAPTITPLPVAVRQGSPTSTTSIATVGDAETAAGALSVLVNGASSATVTGVTVSNLINSNGTITANVVASCTAAQGSVVFTIRVLDVGGRSTEATLSITVQPNLAPTFSYTAQNVGSGGSLNVSPAAGPSDLGGLQPISLISQGTYTGTIIVNNATGLVSLSNAQPVGTHTITIRATDNCGAFTNASFQFTVTGSAAVVVTSTSDSGPGSLRQAIADVAPGGMITFGGLRRPDGMQTIMLTSGELLITKSLTIDGPGADQLSVTRADGSPDFSIFRIPAGVVGSVTINGLTISNGFANSIGGNSSLGGAVNSASQLVLNGVHVLGNQAQFGGGVFLQNSSGSFSNCTFSGNNASTSYGGAISFRLELSSQNILLTIVNSTISGNQAALGGGGVDVGTLLASGSALLDLINTTVVNNSANGVHAASVNGGAATARFRNSIVANNTPDNLHILFDGFPDGSVTFATNGFNLSNNFDGLLTPVSTDIIASPVLGPLQNNGGSTPTHAPLAGSPAIDKGNASGFNTDQRGLTRPVDLPTANAAGGDGADIGSIEAQTLASTCPTIAIGVGQTFSALLDSDSCLINSNKTDLYTLTGMANQQITITMETSQFFSKIELLDPVGAVIQTAGGVNGVNNARLPAGGYFTLPVNGTYTIRAIGAFGGAGSYRISLYEAPVQPCTYSISPGAIDVPASGGAYFFDVITQPGCPPAAQPAASGTTYSGVTYNGGRVRFNVGTNPGAFRFEDITVGGQTFRINQSGTGAPGNDNLANALTISGADGSSGEITSNSVATAEPGEPAHAGNTAAKSVWYTWTTPAQSSGLYSFSTSGSSFDTVMAIYACPAGGGCSFANMTSVGTNDDTTFFDTSSKVNFRADAGTTYLIVVDGKNGASGTVELSWRQYQRLYRLYLQTYNGNPSPLVPDNVTASNGSNTVVPMLVSLGVYEFNLPADNSVYNVAITGPTGIVWDPNNFPLDTSFRYLDELMRGEGGIAGGPNSVSNEQYDTPRIISGYIMNITSSELPSLSVIMGSSRGPNPRDAVPCTPLSSVVFNSVPYAYYQCESQPHTLHDIIPSAAGKSFTISVRSYENFIGNDEFPLPTHPTFVASNLPTYSITGRVLAGGAGTTVDLSYTPPGNNAQIALRSVTNSSGDYSFTNLTPNTYRPRASRTGFVFIQPGNINLTANRTVDIDAENSCVYTPANLATISAAGGLNQFIVTTNQPTCEWRAASDVPWITINSGAIVGNGPVHFTVQPNAGPGRIGTLRVAGRTDPIYVQQATVNPTFGSVSGRVLTLTGVALRNTVVTITDSAGVTQNATTSTFGVYNFTNIQLGQIYTITATSKRFRFGPRVIQVTGNLTGIDFAGLE